jgi:ribosome-associated heat shock protein Hsp15
MRKSTRFSIGRAFRTLPMHLQARSGIPGRGWFSSILHVSPLAPTVISCTADSKPAIIAYNDTMSETVRIDKWLWAARFFKTRSLATDAVDGGKVRLNGDRVKPARGVKVGDKLEIDNGSTEWEILVQDLSDKRGSASIAQTLYSETVQSSLKRQQLAEQRKFFREPSATLKGRPTKRDRRQLDRSNS